MKKEHINVVIFVTDNVVFDEANSTPNNIKAKVVVGGLYYESEGLRHKDEVICDLVKQILDSSPTFYEKKVNSHVSNKYRPLYEGINQGEESPSKTTAVKVISGDKFGVDKVIRVIKIKKSMYSKNPSEARYDNLVAIVPILHIVWFVEKYAVIEKPQSAELPFTARVTAGNSSYSGYDYSIAAAKDWLVAKLLEYEDAVDYISKVASKNKFV